MILIDREGMRVFSRRHGGLPITAPSAPQSGEIRQPADSWVQTLEAAWGMSHPLW